MTELGKSTMALCNKASTKFTDVSKHLMEVYKLFTNIVIIIKNLFYILLAMCYVVTCKNKRI